MSCCGGHTKPRLSIKVKVTNQDLLGFGLPRYQRPGDAGADLYVLLPDEYKGAGMPILPYAHVLLDAGMRIELPDGYYARITHRSSTEYKKHLRVAEGTIDSSYRGQLYTQVVNDTNEVIYVQHGERLAQMIILPVLQADFQVVDELSVTERNEGGFGSTGT